ncbi:type IV pilus secretin family protein [Arenimonas sp.]|uniref:type IV pilus secretin family protein n=1 Tax=Arenimonas sp. TaxID=1872635 RepID=UPI0025E89EED|nr:type IV pilus secretin family protein [Arenimonas sp.]
MTANKTIGEGMGTKRRWVLAMGALAVGLATSLSAMAENVLQDVRYASAPGGKVDITLEFAEPVGEVQAFTTDTPPRIAVDLPGTTNGLSQRRVVIGSGATSAVSAVEAGGRTRVVVDLFRPAGYTTRSAGNLLVLTVDAGAVQQGSLATGPDPTKKVASSLEVANIDFRRGENGSGRVVLRFNGDGAAADMRNEGSRIVVDVANASIPENLRRQLDVTDFATPVRSLEPNANAGSTRLVINTNGAFDSMAYQTGNEYVIEVSPKRAAPGTVVAGAPGRAAGAVAGDMEGQRYSGRAVTFNFQDVPVRTVLQLIAEESGLNVVAADTVQGNVTLRLINVPWDQAMDIVLRAKQLDKRRDGNVIWVAPQKEIADFEKAVADARIANEEREPLITEYIPINYGNAEEIAKLLTEDSKSAQGGGGASGQITRGFLSPRGSVSFDNRTNTLLLIDTQGKVNEIRTLLATLDRPVDQVLIEARIVVATETFARELGVEFGVQDRNGIDPGSTGTTTDSGFSVGLPINPAAGLFNLSILRQDIVLDLELSALEEEGRGEVVSNPRVITANQREAIIRQGDEVAYLTIQPATTPGAVAQATVEFKEVLLELKVTPTITQDGRVYLNLAVKKDEVSELIANPAGGFIPQIARREVSTAVLIDNGQTVVVGGVYEFKNRDDLRKVPFLGDLPVVGNLFKSRSKSAEKAELLIFVTPRVLQVAKNR